MKYQRVLYTNKLTEELKSKLRIVSYKKPRSLKGNVYYVEFASDTDIEYADQTSKHLRNVTLKPFQHRRVFEAQHKSQVNACNNQESLPSSSVPPPSSSSCIPCLPPSAAPTSSSNSKLITSESDSLCRPHETLEEYATPILGPQVATCQNTSSSSIVETTSSVKEQLINDIQLCLNAIETARRAADKVCQLYKRGGDYREALNHLLKLYSISYYLKASTSAQIKVAFSTGLRLPWSTVARNINVLKADVRHEQSFMALTALEKHIVSTIDSTTSISMSSKLIYQLTKLSN